MVAVAGIYPAYSPTSASFVPLQARDRKKKEKEQKKLAEKLAIEDVAAT